MRETEANSLVEERLALRTELDLPVKWKQTFTRATNRA